MENAANGGGCKKANRSAEHPLVRKLIDHPQAIYRPLDSWNSAQARMRHEICILNVHMIYVQVKTRDQQ